MVISTLGSVFFPTLVTLHTSCPPVGAESIGVKSTVSPAYAVPAPRTISMAAESAMIRFFKTISLQGEINVEGRSDPHGAA